MDGADLIRRLNQLMNEDSTSGWLNTRTSYDYLYEAACEFNSRTNRLTGTQSITTVADQSEYEIDQEYMKLYLMNNDGDFFIKLNDGTNDYFIKWKDYGDIIYQNNTDSVTIPKSFSIKDGSLPSRESGTATSDGASSGGECTLTDTAADFSDVIEGAIVHNTTDGSAGVVIGKTSSTVLTTALFDGTNDDWTSADAYVIQPSARYNLVLAPPPSTAGYTVTLYYTKRPKPVYSSYGIYRFPVDIAPALVKYAFWLYKYRNQEPNFGDAMYKFWDLQVRRYADTINHGSRSSRIKISLKKRN